MKKQILSLTKTLLCGGMVLMMSAQQVHAQEEESISGDTEEEALAEMLPDDTLMVHEFYIEIKEEEGATESSLVERAGKLEKELKKKGYIVDQAKPSGMIAMVTTSIQVNNELKTPDREVGVVYALLVKEGSNRIKVRLYAQQKIKSGKKEWSMADARTKDRLISWNKEMEANLTKVFIGKKSSILED